MNLLLFGITKDIIGEKGIPEAKLKHIKSVENLKLFLFESYPELATLSSLNIAVNEVMVTSENVTLHANDTIALIPPVSGG